MYTKQEGKIINCKQAKFVIQLKAKSKISLKTVVCMLDFLIMTEMD